VNLSEAEYWNWIASDEPDGTPVVVLAVLIGLVFEYQAMERLWLDNEVVVLQAVIADIIAGEWNTRCILQDLSVYNVIYENKDLKWQGH